MRIKVAILCLFVAAFTCKSSHAPVIRNTLTRAVILTVEYRNGESFSGKYPPGATIWAPTEAIAVDRIEVQTGDEVTIRLDGEALELLSSRFPPGTRLMWEIREVSVFTSMGPGLFKTFPPTTHVTTFGAA